MTQGQQLAVEQLRGIGKAASGVIEVLDVNDTLDGTAYVFVELLIDCSDRPCVNGGVQFRRNERFIIGVPPDFPYRIPEIATPHTRFAGLPHVQFASYLCLYQAPNTEWNVDDGMFGYLTRLNDWLDHAARGELNPSGEALHPPVAYQSTSGRIIIPRVDAPSVSNHNWVGFGCLRNVSDRWVDVIDWLELGASNLASPVAPAFLLADIMPYEYPRTMGDLSRALSTRGVSTELIVAALRYAVLVNEDDSPLYVILGAPMRGVAGTDRRNYHLAAWHVSPTIVKGLRLSLAKYDPNPEVQKIGEEVERLVTEALSEATVEWCQVLEDRPEIVTRRDKGSALAWLQGKTVALWGCGAIGSHLAEFLVRAA